MVTKPDLISLGSTFCCSVINMLLVQRKNGNKDAEERLTIVTLDSAMVTLSSSCRSISSHSCLDPLDDSIVNNYHCLPLFQNMSSSPFQNSFFFNIEPTGVVQLWGHSERILKPTNKQKKPLPERLEWVVRMGLNISNNCSPPLPSGFTSKMAFLKL